MTDDSLNLMGAIPSFLSTRWKRKPLPVLLSAFGGLIPPEARAELRLTKMSLKDYIRAHLADQVRVISIPQKGDAIVPVLETRGLADEELIRLYHEGARDKFKSSGGRFFPNIWAAFFNPLQTKRRFIRLAPGKPEVIEDENGKELEDGWLEVKEADLPSVQPGTAPFPPDVSHAIKCWAEQNAINVDDLYLKETSDFSPHSPSQLLPSTGLMEILNLLQPHELSRINIPADIVISVLRRASK